VVQAGIEALGGQAYLDVENAVSSGRYFFFRKGRKGFTRFADWTVFTEPILSRFMVGKGKNATIYVHNMRLEKGWKQEGPSSVEELPEEELKDFTRSVKRDMDFLFRNRLDEEGLKLFYYGRDDIDGSGELEAVEFIDLANDAVVVYFDLEKHLPVKTEHFFTDDVGVRHKRQTEFYNWHQFGGVNAPMRMDTFVDDELAEQRFLEELEFNVPIPPEHFLEPVVKEKKKKKK
jgi:hypothetical protein